MTCTSCGATKRKGTTFHLDTERANGTLCTDCFEEFRDLARGSNGCVLGDCTAEFDMQRDSLNDLDQELGHRSRIPILCDAHRRTLES